MASYEMEETLLVSGIFSFVLYPIMAFYEAQKERWLVSPLVAYLGMSALYIGAGSLWAYSSLATGHEWLHSIGFLVIARDMPMAAAVGLTGITSYYVGYKLTQIPIILRFGERFSKRSSNLQMNLTIWLSFIGLAWLARIGLRAGLPLWKFGAFNRYIIIATTAGAFILLISNVQFSGSRFWIKPAGWRMYLALAAVLIELIFHSFQSGMRHPLLNLTILVLWGYVLQRETFIKSPLAMERIRAYIKPALAFAVASCLVLFIIVPFGKMIAGRGQAPESEEVWYITFNLRETFPERGVWSLPKRVASASMHGTGACVQLRSFLPPEQKVMDTVFMGVVPRLLWPEKPFVTQGAAFSVILRLGVGIDEESSTTATAMTSPGQLYWSYGLTGVMIGMILMGIFVGFTFNIFSRDFPLHPVRTMVTITLVLQAFMWYEGDATTIFVAIIYMWVVLYPLSLLKLPFIRKLA
jgi:hypothetical protein